MNQRNLSSKLELKKYKATEIMLFVNNKLNLKGNVILSFDEGFALIMKKGELVCVQLPYILSR